VYLKGDKVIVFKKKEEKDTKNGHRQFLTQIVIEGITAAGAKTSKKEAALEAAAAEAGTEEAPKVKKSS
jgi:large subunit ribosomal protein L21